MKKNPFTPFAVLFLVMLVAMPALYFLLPWQTYSEEERRVLADPPAFSLDQWSDDTETFLADHLPLRKVLTGLHAVTRKATGMDVLGEVWQLPSGRLAEAPLTRDDERMLKNVGRMAEFARTQDLPLYLLAVPSAGAVCGEKTLLPYPDGEILSLLDRQEGAVLIPVMDAFQAAEEPLYYATDPHWNARGAYLAYTRIAEELGFTPLAPENFSVETSEGFYGTCYTRSALWNLKPDTLEMWDHGMPLQVTLDEEDTQSSLFWREHLKGGDQYPVFLDGNHGLTRIVNPQAPADTALLILKDSFANSLMPLLSANYRPNTNIDLRAYPGSVAPLAQEGNYQAILAVYSLGRLIEDVNFAWLR